MVPYKNDVPGTGYEIAVIPATTDPSNWIDVGSAVYLLLEMPAAWTAADLLVQAKVQGDGGSVTDDSGIATTLTVSAGKLVGISMVALQIAGARFIRFKSVSTANSDTAVAQAAARTIYVGLKG